MAYDDKDEGRVFPTRTGVATGSANERTMLDVVGASGIRTQNRDIVGPEGQKGTVRLRTRGGSPEFVTEFEPVDTRSKKEVYMDSGALDLLSVNLTNPLALQDAILYYASAQKAYFTSNKLLAKIAPPAIAAINPPANATAGKSFKASTPPANRGISPDASTSMLYAKKVCAARCPASVFTGKTKLFVQAHYGAPLPDFRWTLNEVSGSPPELIHGNGATVSTNSGVYRDAQSRHWLITVTPTGVRITALVPEAAVAPLVPHLQNSIYTADVDKIEAYILAYSHPSTTMTFDIAMTIPETQMMGYGWKFSWDGDKASIIKHDPVPQSGGRTYFDATRYELTFSRNGTMSVVGDAVTAEKSRWTVTLAAVEGPTLWHNNYTGECIAFPLWGVGELAKFGSRGGASIGPNAPVYCFYKRNTLEVLRYYSNGGGRWFTDTNIPKYQMDSSPIAYYGKHDWTTYTFPDYTRPFGTIGAGGGWGEYRMTLDKPFDRAFTSSGATTFASTHSYSYDRYQTGTKNFYSLEDALGEYTGAVGDIYENVNSPIYTTGPWPGTQAPDGVVLTVGGNETPSGNTFLGNGYYGVLPGTKISWHYESVSGNQSEGADMVLIVPFYDAQAAYLYGVKSESRSESGTEGDKNTWNGAWGYWSRIMQSADEGLTYYEVMRIFIDRGHSATLGFDGAGTPVSRTYPTRYTVTGSTLVTSVGDFSFTPTSSMGPFADGLVDSVPQTYHTQTSTMGSVFGQGVTNLDGLDNVFTGPPPFIGWI